MSQSRNCWYCGRATMEPVADAKYPYSKCSACGATNVPLATLGKPVAIIKRKTSVDPIGEKRRRWVPKPEKKKT